MHVLMSACMVFKYVVLFCSVVYGILVIILGVKVKLLQCKPINYTPSIISAFIKHLCIVGPGQIVSVQQCDNPVCS